MTKIRIATLDDIPTLVSIRKRLLVEEGQQMTIDIDSKLETFFDTQMNSNTLVHWLIEEQGQLAAAGGIQYITFPPSFYNPTGIRGYILNMFTEDSFRKRGLATQILQQCEQHARGQGVHHLFLISSEAGKSVYRKYGFTPNDIYMEKLLNK